MNRTKTCIAGIAALSLIALSACGSGGGGSDEYSPGRQISYLVGYQAGGGTDTVARKAAELVESFDSIDSTVTVENQPGGGGVRALAALAKSKTDTLLALPDVPTGLLAEDSPVTFDQIRPIAQLANTPLVVVAPADSPYETLEDLLKDVTAEGNVGLGSGMDSLEVVQWNQMAEAAGVDGDINHVTSEGTAAVATEIVAGRIDATTMPRAAAAEFIKSGDLKAMAIGSEERSDELPDVPTLQEEGIDMILSRPQGVAISAETSDAEADFWEEQMLALTEDEEFVEFLDGVGYDAEYLGSEDYQAWLDEQMSAYTDYFESQ